MKRKKQDLKLYISIIILVAVVAVFLLVSNGNNFSSIGEAARKFVSGNNDRFGEQAVSKKTVVSTRVSPPQIFQISSCGFKNWKKGATYVLSKDLSITGGETCLRPTFGNIIIDCNDHSITGNYPESASIGIYLDEWENKYSGSISHIRNVTIKDCIISNVGTGLEIVSSSKHTIKNNVITGSDIGILFRANIYFDTNGNPIGNVAVRSYIVDNTISNSRIGILIKEMSNDNNFVNNVVCGSETYDLGCSSETLDNHGSGNMFGKVSRCDDFWPREGVDYTSC